MDKVKHFLNQPYINRLLKDKISGSLSTGYLFYSLDSQTNYNALKCLALSLICEQNGCFLCPDCQKAKIEAHPDILIYPKGKLFGVADSKDIIEQANKKPMLADKKIIVINDFDNSSDEAQNKLLKTLEEPPNGVIFILSTINLDKVLPTIKSRLIKIEVTPFTNQQISNIFSDYISHQSFELAIQNGRGYIGKTLQILDDDNYLNFYNLSKNIVCNLKSSAEVVNYLPNKIDKNQFSTLLEIMQSMYRDILVINNNQPNLVKNDNIIANLHSVSGEFSNRALIKIIQKINNANQKQFSNVSINLILETLLVSILEVKFLCK